MFVPPIGGGLFDRLARHSGGRESQVPMPVPIPYEITLELAKVLIGITADSTKEKIKRAMEQEKLEEKLKILRVLRELGEITEDEYNGLKKIAVETFMRG